MNLQKRYFSHELLADHYDDLLHEAALATLEREPLPRKAVAHYIYRITRDRKRVFCLDPIIEESEGNEKERSYFCDPSSNYDVMEFEMWMDIRKKLEAFARLPRPYRFKRVPIDRYMMILQLRYAGYLFEEIARAVGLSITQVKIDLNTLRKILLEDSEASTAQKDIRANEGGMDLSTSLTGKVGKAEPSLRALVIVFVIVAVLAASAVIYAVGSPPKAPTNLRIQ